MQRRFVVVTTGTGRRGVFAGTLEAQTSGENSPGFSVVLTDARNCIYWSEATHGVLGLAANGPADGSRVGPAVPRLEIDGVTAIIDCNDAARERWESEPWS